MKYTKICDECGSPFFEGASQMQSLCPECAHRLYGYPKCRHEFENGRCIFCGWNGTISSYLSKGDPMLTTEPTKEMLQEWKNLHKQYRPLLSPNRRSGAQVDAYFRNTYPHTLLDSEELREMIAAEILENPHHAEKLPPESMPDVHCYMTENVLVGIDLVTGHIHVECEEITKSVQIYDALFVYRGLDEADLENAFLTAEYVRLAQEAYGDGFLTEDGICQRTQD